MSKVFNDTSNNLGLVQAYELEIGANIGDVSGDTEKLKNFTAGTRSAHDKYFSIAMQAGGRWQLDDSNQTDYPIIKTNILSGQNDYAFTVDGSSNLILDIYRVLVLPSATATTYQDILPIDAQTRDEVGWQNDLAEETGVTGVPTGYDKTANGIFLTPTPNYNATSGLKVYINREASYFVYTDTTKKPGVPGLHHDYFYLYPAMEYIRRNGTNDAYTKVANEVAKMERDIEQYFGRRGKDEVPMMINEPIIYE